MRRVSINHSESFKFNATSTRRQVSIAAFAGTDGIPFSETIQCIEYTVES